MVYSHVAELVQLGVGVTSWQSRPTRSTTDSGNGTTFVHARLQSVSIVLLHRQALANTIELRAGSQLWPFRVSQQNRMMIMRDARRLPASKSPRRLCGWKCRSHTQLSLPAAASFLTPPGRGTEVPTLIASHTEYGVRICNNAARPACVGGTSGNTPYPLPPECAETARAVEGNGTSGSPSCSITRTTVPAYSHHLENV